MQTRSTRPTEPTDSSSGLRDTRGRRAQIVFPEDITPTERFERLLSDAGGSLDRAEVFRCLAPRLGLRSTRLTLGLAIAAGIVTLDDEDRLTHAEPRA